ncbi:Protein of unknown function [Lactobacillus delbrueckii subsp. bulgaricus]|nr:Protein of unknown function [Lactobacillus delbrueckii subsp. bulgaricus]CDR74199.1 Protein of unknown function [Lactobacillus delbrueckii subsp. bulgaricus]CDR76455.1 Putative uncharacterized protein [Lactobacillus delbrueckii subsp. lactis]CDR79682.1 Protein of unknown function [Lactobacillus delbrueckii subsp. lactis]
MAAGKFTEEQR